MTDEQHNRINQRLRELEKENSALRRQAQESTALLNGIVENMAYCLAKLARTAQSGSGKLRT